ncbi:MAG: hypothetical protein QG640_726 [Patescibacteria group bacterium]|nr:hypothetical protein [Patescibacteria group bacterium]
MSNENEENEVVTKGYLREELKIFGTELKNELKAEFKSEIHGLAIIINGAFANQQKYMDGRFERIETRLDKVENTLEKVEIRLESVEYKVDVLQEEMELVNKRQIKTEKRIEKLEIATI